MTGDGVRDECNAHDGFAMLGRDEEDAARERLQLQRRHHVSFAALEQHEGEILLPVDRPVTVGVHLGTRGYWTTSVSHPSPWTLLLRW